MKLISLCHDALPARSAYTQQLVCTMTELARLGHDVQVFARNSGNTGASLRERIAQYYGIDQLPASIEFVPSGPIASHNELIGGLMDVLNVSRARKEERALVITRDAFALSLALAVGLPCVFETYKVSINTDPRFVPWRAFCYSRKNLLGVVTHSDFCRESFINAGLPKHRVETIYNGFAPEHFAPALSRENARAQLQLNGAKHIATYAGHVDLTKGIDFLLHMAAQVPDVKFLLLGAIPGSEDEKDVRRRIDELDATNVCVLPRVRQSQVPPYLFASDCLIIPPSSAPLRKHRNTVLPMKSFSYLAAGRPIVAPDLVDLREMFRSTENALLVPPDDVDAAAAAVRRAVTDNALAEELGNQARRDATRHTWAKRAERLANFLENLRAA